MTKLLQQSSLRRHLARALEEDVRAIALEEGRRVGTPGHLIVEDYLETRLAEIGCEPYDGDSFRLPYEDGGEKFTNLVGVVPGQNPKKRPLLIGAHYDSVIDAPCADDNAAAVAIALAVGEMASSYEALERDLVVAIFDAEEPPYFQSSAMGSNRFYKDQMKPEGVHAALVMDLVGHDISVTGEMLGAVPGIGGLLARLPGFGGKDLGVPFLSDLLFVTGAESHPALSEILDDHSDPKGLKVLPTLNRYVGDMSDHGSFRRKGVPYLFLSCGRWAHYHEPTDTPERLNYKKMAAIACYAALLLGLMDNRPMPRGKKEKTHDTLALEKRQLGRILGPARQPILKLLGVGDISTRKDMNRFVNALMASGI
jgi:hypothetical protein